MAARAQRGRDSTPVVKLKQGCFALQGAALFVGVVLALAEAAPQDLLPQDPLAPLTPMDDAKARVEVVMVTQSPAEAIQEAIRYDPEVAAALQSNSTNL